MAISLVTRHSTQMIQIGSSSDTIQDLKDWLDNNSGHSSTQTVRGLIRLSRPLYFPTGVYVSWMALIEFELQSGVCVSTVDYNSDNPTGIKFLSGSVVLWDINDTLIPSGIHDQTPQFWYDNGSSLVRIEKHQYTPVEYEDCQIIYNGRRSGSSKGGYIINRAVGSGKDAVRFTVADESLDKFERIFVGANYNIINQRIDGAEKIVFNDLDRDKGGENFRGVVITGTNTHMDLQGCTALDGVRFDGNTRTSDLFIGYFGSGNTPRRAMKWFADMWPYLPSGASGHMPLFQKHSASSLDDLPWYFGDIVNFRAIEPNGTPIEGMKVYLFLRKGSSSMRKETAIDHRDRYISYAYNSDTYGEVTSSERNNAGQNIRTRVEDNTSLNGADFLVTNSNGYTTRDGETAITKPQLPVAEFQYNGTISSFTRTNYSHHRLVCVSYEHIFREVTITTRDDDDDDDDGDSKNIPAITEFVVDTYIEETDPDVVRAYTELETKQKRYEYFKVRIMDILADIDPDDSDLDRTVDLNPMTLDGDAGDKDVKVALAFDSSKDYSSGQVVYQDSKIYEADAAITAGTFTESEWTEIAEDIAHISNDNETIYWYMGTGYEGNITTEGVVTVEDFNDIDGAVIDSAFDSSYVMTAVNRWKVYPTEADRKAETNLIDSGMGEKSYRYNHDEGSIIYFSIQPNKNDPYLNLDIDDDEAGIHTFQETSAYLLNQNKQRIESIPVVVRLDTSADEDGDGTNKPFNSLDSLEDFMESTPVRTVVLYNTLVLDRDLNSGSDKSFKLIGAVLGESTIDFNGYGSNKVEYKELILTGEFGGDGVLNTEGCILKNLSGVGHGTFRKSSVDGELTFKTDTKVAKFETLSNRRPDDEGPVVLNFQGAEECHVRIDDFKGEVEAKNLTHADSHFEIEGINAFVTIKSTCTGRAIEVISGHEITVETGATEPVKHDLIDEFFSHLISGLTNISLQGAIKFLYELEKKIETMLVQDGSVYKYTENALEEVEALEIESLEIEESIIHDALDSYENKDDYKGSSSSDGLTSRDRKVINQTLSILQNNFSISRRNKPKRRLP